MIWLVHPPPSAKSGKMIAPEAAGELRLVTGRVVIRNSDRSLVSPCKRAEDRHQAKFGERHHGCVQPGP